MNQTAILEWLPQLQRIGVALVIGFVPALIARWKRRPMTPWYLYGFVCALLAWPAVALPAIHALLVRPHGKPEQISQQRRRASALEHFSIRLGVSRVCEISFAFFFGNPFEKRGDCSPKLLNSARLHFA